MSDFATALVRAGSPDVFEHGGLVYSHGVPSECVRAYAVARLAKKPAADILAAIVAAYVGEGFDPPVDDGRSMIWLCARGWASRLADLERKVRGLAA